MPFEDLIGAEDIVGTQFGADRDLRALMSGYPIVGTRFGADDAVAVNNAALMQQLAAKQAMAVVPRPVTKGRVYTLGFPATVIAAGASATIVTQPQVPFKGHRLVIPSDFAGAVSITDLKVGKNSQFATSAAVPGRTFTEFAVGMDLGLDTAQISQQITLAVTNTSGSSITFTASLIGSAVE